MNDEVRVTLNIAQLVVLGGLVWGLARMSKAVDVLGTVTTNLTRGLETISLSLNTLVGRVLVLEDRSDRRPDSPR